ncbi:CHASE2 domain-containing protein [Scytonema sp. NUACC26]|uniref:CHASE2 domain-containing protein n=1 Tax=Scytonema sp. NUACC26 TaxID=3140176 RepID=UPI0034DC4D50
MNNDTRVKTILILAANPASTSRLRLDEEVREIEEGLRRANKREQFKLEQKWAVRQRDFYRAILDYQPQIVHFSGHGTGEDGIVLENDIGQVELLSAAELGSMFKLFALESVECVVLNACYSKTQAEEISRSVNYVIGTNRIIGDRCAVTLATAFYDALAAGKNIPFAFELGCSRLVGLKEHQTPILLINQSIAPIPKKTRKRIFISYKRNVEPDEPVALQVYKELSQHHDVFIDQKMLVGTHWIDYIETKICQADFFIVFFSAWSVHSEIVEWEIRKAYELAQIQGGNYRHPDRLAPEVTLTQMLTGSVDPKLVKDRLVIVGTKTPSLHPGFYTPYTALPDQPARTSPALIHAQVASHIISVVLDGRLQIQYLSETIEIIWIYTVALMGSVLASQVQDPLRLKLLQGIAVFSVVGIGFGLFQLGVWMPIVSLVSVLIISGTYVKIYVHIKFKFNVIWLNNKLFKNLIR